MSTETVKPKTSEKSPKEEEVSPTLPSTLTEDSAGVWKMLEKAEVTPSRLRCDGYTGEHPADLSCHSNLHPTAENVIRHVKHGDGRMWFTFKLRNKSSKDNKDAKVNTLWKDLSEAGMNVSDIRCLHCSKEIDGTVRSLFYHLNPHPGDIKQNLYPATLGMTLTTEQTDITPLEEPEERFFERRRV